MGFNSGFKGLNMMARTRVNVAFMRTLRVLLIIFTGELFRWIGTFCEI